MNEKIPQSHFHFQILAYERKENNQFYGVVNLDIIADGEIEAIAKAKKILTRPNYYVAGARECTHCDTLKNMTKALQKHLE